MKTTIHFVCPLCSDRHSVTVDATDYDRYMSGKLAQVAFPHLSATECEQIISHICPYCQKGIFGEGEND